jgi:hypothetical protein
MFPGLRASPGFYSSQTLGLYPIEYVTRLGPRCNASFHDLTPLLSKLPSKRGRFTSSPFVIRYSLDPGPRHFLSGHSRHLRYSSSPTILSTSPFDFQKFFQFLPTPSMHFHRIFNIFLSNHHSFDQRIFISVLFARLYLTRHFTPYYYLRLILFDPLFLHQLSLSWKFNAIRHFEQYAITQLQCIYNKAIKFVLR